MSRPRELSGPLNDLVARLLGLDDSPLSSIPSITFADEGASGGIILPSSDMNDDCRTNAARKVDVSLRRDETSPMQPIDLLEHPTTSDKLRSNSRHKLLSPAAKKTAQLFERMCERAGGKEEVEEMLQRLTDSKLFIGDFGSEHNSRLLRRYLGIPKDSRDNKKQGAQFFVKISWEDIEWWTVSGPLIKKPEAEPRNHKFATKAAQFNYYAENVLRDRTDSASVQEYESAASALNLPPWSGTLIERIVSQACTLQGLPDRPTRLGGKDRDNISSLSKESLQAARAIVLPDMKMRKRKAEDDRAPAKRTRKG